MVHFRPRHLALSLLLLASCGASANDHLLLNEDQIKAGFLLNFMHFVEWPDSAFLQPSAPFNACIVGDPSVTALLTQSAAGKSAAAHPIVVRAARAADDLRSCHLVYIASTDDRQNQRILESLKGVPALTIGQSSGFLRRGVLNFVTLDTVKLELNLEAANRANLKISARLIAVSHLVKGGE